MKRKLILLVVTIVFLVGFGVILHSPPSMIDARGNSFSIFSVSREMELIKALPG